MKRTTAKATKAKARKRAPSKTVKNGRTARGRFAVGNKGGPGRKRKGEDAEAFAEQAVPAEEVWQALAKAIRKGSITAIRTYLEYRHGRPWTEAEILEQKEIDDAERRIREAQERRNNGHVEKAEGGGAAEAGAPGQPEQGSVDNRDGVGERPGAGGGAGTDTARGAAAHDGGGDSPG